MVVVQFKFPLSFFSMFFFLFVVLRTSPSGWRSAVATNTLPSSSARWKQERQRSPPSSTSLPSRQIFFHSFFFIKPSLCTGARTESEPAWWEHTKLSLWSAHIVHCGFFFTLLKFVNQEKKQTNKTNMSNRVDSSTWVKSDNIYICIEPLTGSHVS